MFSSERFALSFAFALSACGTDSYTPACPELIRFDVRDPAERQNPEVVRARALAVEAGCLTPLGAPAPELVGGRGGESGLAPGTTAGADANSAGDGGASP
jgi:hypothetical protein